MTDNPNEWHTTLRARIKALTAELNEVRKEWEGWQSTAVKLMEKVIALTAERDRLREALEQFLIEYDEVDLADAEPSSLTAAVLSARAVLKGERHE